MDQIKVIKLILGEKSSGSEIGLLILDYSENSDMDKNERTEILMELLKGEFSDLIKSKARKLIRQK